MHLKVLPLITFLAPTWLHGVPFLMVAASA
jgi:hypothetical protein